MFYLENNAAPLVPPRNSIELHYKDLQNPIRDSSF